MFRQLAGPRFAVSAPLSHVRPALDVKHFHLISDAGIEALAIEIETAEHSGGPGQASPRTGHSPALIRAAGGVTDKTKGRGGTRPFACRQTVTATARLAAHCQSPPGFTFLPVGRLGNEPTVRGRGA